MTSTVQPAEYGAGGAGKGMLPFDGDDGIRGGPGAGFGIGAEVFRAGDFVW